MATAKIELPDGTVISIEGTAEEVAKVTSLYNAPRGVPLAGSPRAESKIDIKTSGDSDKALDIPELVEEIKNCDDAQKIEVNILDQRDALNRVLLPIYIANKYINQNIGLTSGEIQTITDQLGVKVPISSASRMLSGKAKPYVSGDSVRKKGAPVRYKMTRRGVQYMEDVISR